MHPASFIIIARFTVIDPITSAMAKIPAKKLEVNSLKIKVDKALAGPAMVTLESISLLQSDLSDLFKSLVDISDHGVLFNKGTLGATRDELSE